MKKYYKSFIMALSMFTILPTPYIDWDDEGIKNMMKFYPIVGLIIGVIWSGSYYILSFLNCSIILKSGILLVIPFILSGMLHLDGFMDVCDAILSRRDRKEKLRILKDSATGAFAVISLVIIFFLQFGGIYSIIEKSNLLLSEGMFKFGSSIYGFLLIPVISRSTAAYFLLTKITIKESSLGSYFKKGTNLSDVIIMVLAVIICTIGFGFLIKIKYILIPILMIIGINIGVKKCIKEFGGVSGDVAGFALVIGELIGIIALATI